MPPARVAMQRGQSGRSGRGGECLSRGRTGRETGAVRGLGRPTRGRRNDSVCEDYCSRTWSHTFCIIDGGCGPEDSVKGKICPARALWRKTRFPPLFRK